MVVVKLVVSENKHDTSLLRVYDDDIYRHNSSVHPHTPHPTPLNKVMNIKAEYEVVFKFSFANKN